MSEQRKKIIILYAILCFIISLVMGIIGDVSFGGIIVRSIFFTIIGTLIAVGIVSLFPLFFASENNDKNHLNDDDDGSIYPNPNPNAGLYAQSYASNNMSSNNGGTQVFDTEEKKRHDNSVNPFGGNYSEENEGTKPKVDIVLDDNQDEYNQENGSVMQHNEANDTFKSYSSDPALHIKDHEWKHNSDFSVDVDATELKPALQRTIKDKDVAREKDKTTEEFRNSPEKVGKAVASWIKNEDNSN